jgi:Fe-Mn family superoxide dismutase
LASALHRCASGASRDLTPARARRRVALYKGTEVMANPVRAGQGAKPRSPYYQLPDLPYDVSALEPHYSARALELHHDKHHAAYVKGLNSTLERIGEARGRGDYETIVGLEKSLAFNLSGHVLHSLFWQNHSPEGGERPDGALADAIDEYFGSFDAFRQQLTKVTTSVQGSGWGALAWEPLGRRLVVEQIYDHQGNIGSGSLPLLVIDAWEHAFYLQFQTRKADYVEALWNVVHWQDVGRRFERVRGYSLL